MLDKLLPRSIRDSRLRKHELRTLNELEDASLDTCRLRKDPPDVAPFSNEWASVTEVMRAVGLENPRGGVNIGDRRLIYQLARALNAKSILEVGTHVGASTLMLSLAAKQNGGSLTTVDIADVNASNAYWHRFGCRQSPAASLRLASVSARFEQCDSVEWLAKDTATYDLIFLDGLHEAQQLYRELPHALKRLNANGLILLHDVFPNCAPLWNDGNVIPGPWLAVERYLKACAGIRVQPLGELPWPTKEGSHVTSLAYVLS